MNINTDKKPGIPKKQQTALYLLFIINCIIKNIRSNNLYLDFELIKNGVWICGMVRNKKEKELNNGLGGKAGHEFLVLT